MEQKVLLSVAVAFVFFQYAHSLRCYTCSSKDPDRACASPLDTSKIVPEECNKTTQYSSTPFGGIAEHMLKAVANSSEYQCITYEKFYFHDNTTQTVRRCMKKLEQFCSYLNETAEQENTHNVTKCVICNTDDCNSTTSLQISGILCLFGLILGSTFK